MTEVSLKRKRIVILLADAFEDATVLYPTLYWSGLGAEIRLVCVPARLPGEPPVTGLYGLTVPMQGIPAGSRYRIGELKDCKAEEVDAVVLPGGFAADSLRQDGKVLDFIAEMSDRERVIASIGHGIQVLISTDALRKTEILKGHGVTGSTSLSVDVSHARGRFENEAAMVDGALVTGRNADDLPEFCEGVVLALQQIPRPRKRR